MTKDELFAAARGRPAPFEYEGFRCYLLPVAWGDLRALQSRHKDGDGADDERLTLEVVAQAVCDEEGGAILEPDDCLRFPLPLLKALFEEVARRSGVAPEGDDAGKDLPPTTS